MPTLGVWRSDTPAGARTGRVQEAFAGEQAELLSTHPSTEQETRLPEAFAD
ncbi:DUF1269 domain-containing protein [Geodermatophilus sabuli]|uniref:Uncharacterized protein n=1 Tax=Geodermatophilus sabuli TaxID=1564158 RepID=A0A285EJM1_9ACTN|nr:DUF1269 domain-containing protein [Geodermatophilus sabuli]MBB3083769.1 hypothetical protein [Geodermatophilus sabuli]SNX99197.1 hypothetical protein SAMN06893097_11573 [Geodermatophilus sabuli]